ncbi:HGR075Wp [Eremothecium sinecaudum]|uniref:HGR075Wp n=1 Tax=Eremothecium sinecaudum TaxID=45286 RepID=A0A0X8HVT2_9SACH|nr:HGR075Wp [Eremothecium sinecaudum]AMD22414.1 HGR075Wp [Eremothecium sinecaudum]
MPILEEIDDNYDVDNMHMEAAEFDANLKTPIAAKITPTLVRSQDTEDPPLFPAVPESFSNNRNINFGNQNTGKTEDIGELLKDDMEELKDFQLLYPCYFDKRRTHAQGRKVPMELAVENPLAISIAKACSGMGLLCVFEAEKTHPQDFGNPGRVRVALKEDGVPNIKEYSNKRWLMKKVAEYLQEHPTTLLSPKEVPYGQEFAGVEPKRIPFVKGFKMNDIVPLNSPFNIGHPMTKSIYDAPKAVTADKQTKVPKTKYKVVRR